MKNENPCVTCGACCCYYRVSFHWMECDPEGVTGPLPEHTVARDHHRVFMKGTKNKPVRCIELSGEVCSSVGCLIYERRASPCRNFGVQMQGDNFWTITADDLRYCNEARAHFHLLPLVPPTPEVIPTVVPPNPKTV